MEKILTEKDIEAVILEGTSAHSAALGTAIGVAMRKLKIIVPADGMSASNACAEQYTAWHPVNGLGQGKLTTLNKSARANSKNCFCLRFGERAQVTTLRPREDLVRDNQGPLAEPQNLD